MVGTNNPPLQAESEHPAASGLASAKVSVAEGLWVDITQIDVLDYARQASPEGIEALGADLGRNGQLQNIVLVKKSDGRFECVLGNRRLAAVRKLGWEKIRADVKENLSEAQKLALVVAENEEREDACPFYTAMLIARQFKASGKTQEEFEKESGRDQTVLSRYLSLAKVPPEVWKEHQSALTSMRQCLEVAKVKDVEHQKKLAEACASEGLTGAAAKKRAKAIVSGQEAEPAQKKKKAHEAPFVFAWKGNGVLIKRARVYLPHAQPFSSYLDELSTAFDAFMEAEKANAKAA